MRPVGTCNHGAHQLTMKSSNYRIVEPPNLSALPLYRVCAISLNANEEDVLVYEALYRHIVKHESQIVPGSVSRLYRIKHNAETLVSAMYHNTSFGVLV